MTAAENKSFIKVNERQFILDGNPYFFVGTNMWYGAYLGSPGKTGNRERLKKELDALVSLGITNLRICAGSEESEMSCAITPAFQTAPRVYNEELLEGLDYLLCEMAKRNMHAVLFINNYWQWTGGTAQYNSWVTGKKIPDPDDPKFGYSMFMDFSSEFYLNKEAQECFNDYVRMIVIRKNKFTEIIYKDDPTIMAWQLANEPRPGRSLDVIKTADVFYKWIDETANLIHSLDPNHLVSTGSEGLAGSLELKEIYMKAHKSKYIDYATMHLWAKNWSWFDATNAEETYPIAEQNAIEYVKQHLKYARKLKKPITLEEFGIPRDLEKYKSGTPTTYRDKYFKKIFELVYESAADGKPIGGTNIWAWGGTGRNNSNDDTWREGDDYLGDPPQEPQGLNSIYNSDTSTLEIIKSHAEKLKLLRNGKKAPIIK
jgi:mannan endo-1,4-beta-mannosidase